MEKKNFKTKFQNKIWKKKHVTKLVCATLYSCLASTPHYRNGNMTGKMPGHITGHITSYITGHITCHFSGFFTGHVTRIIINYFTVLYDKWPRKPTSAILYYATREQSKWNFGFSSVQYTILFSRFWMKRPYLYTCNSASQVGFAEFNNTADNRANIGGTIIGAPIVGQ